MRTLQQWLDAYGESHQNGTNRKIHKVAVPGIFLSIVGLIFSIPPLELFGLSLNWIWIVLLPVMAFYLSLSMSVFLSMLSFSLLCIGIVFVLQEQINIFNWSVGLFVVLWIFQFIGHKIEGKKPSFFDDVQFLLIGPIWVFKQKV
ncbi:hypothetical protein ST37_16580 [Vibrio sp. qd031]|uniref:Mpo1 family 2-hydroxy fatty acid dioxygenase n=1 Tax=Vibrio sp. qd031 TaxID=1603038 RepID=UPI000A10A02D|nr:Mpo1-like protein [Vibrio sp. qd031]ORT48695.1 hypothetical protein ST37_16580 [Vibrio sp. qd031]